MGSSLSAAACAAPSAGLSAPFCAWAVVSAFDEGAGEFPPEHAVKLKVNAHAITRDKTFFILLFLSNHWFYCFKYHVLF